jgi:hypothetical protein
MSCQSLPNLICFSISLALLGDTSKTASQSTWNCSYIEAHDPINILLRFSTHPSQISFKISRQPTFTNIIHLRDFINAIIDNLTQENALNFVKIHIDINIFKEDRFYNPNIIAKPIRTYIHTYLTREERDLYVSNNFFYANGRLFTALLIDNTL